MNHEQSSTLLHNGENLSARNTRNDEDVYGKVSGEVIIIRYDRRRVNSTYGTERQTDQANRRRTPDKF